jgi:hypothetical protein
MKRVWVTCRNRLGYVLNAGRSHLYTGARHLSLTQSAILVTKIPSEFLKNGTVVAS